MIIYLNISFKWLSELWAIIFLFKTLFLERTQFLKLTHFPWNSKTHLDSNVQS